jgi:hypothetical protein
MRCRRLVLLAPLLAALGPFIATPVARATERPLLRAVAAAGTGPVTPAEIHSAYALPDRGAPGQTIAVVSAYDDPSIQADLAAYDAHFGLPACTFADGCLRKVNEHGQSRPYPGPDVSGGQWVTESALGTEIAHGVCQSCRLLLVEAETASKLDISTAVAGAAKAGATVVVTNFNGGEDSIDNDWGSNYLQAKAAIVAAAGDAQGGTYGYTGEPSFPSNLPSVLGVGGTSLRVGSSGRYAGEMAWPGTVSGCSLFQLAASWQTAAAKAAGCGTHRATADLSAVATPGALVHITGAGLAGGPWYTAEGTSLSAPIIAGVIGLAGSLGDQETQTLYARARTDPGAFHDIRAGVNAPACESLICRAAPGWDGPTGLGTPYGLAAFLPSGGALDPRRPEITIPLPHGRLTAGRQWGLRVSVANGNAFALTGTVVLRRTLRLNGRFQTLTLASAALGPGPLATTAVRLTIAKQWRSLVRQRGSLEAWAFVRVRGPAGRAVTVKRAVTLAAP